MNVKKNIGQFIIVLITAIIAFIIASPVYANGFSGKSRGNAYVMSNSPVENRVIAYKRFPNGKLKQFGSVRTGGIGAGDNAPNDPLGSQGSVMLSEDRRTLYVVNAGSNDISVFHLKRNGRPILVQVVDSNGIFPVSLTTDGEILYVLNSGDDGTISGYHISDFGRLTPIPNSVRALGLGEDGPPIGDARNLAPGAIAFDPLSRRIFIPYAGGGSNGELLTFTLNDDDTPSPAVTVTESPGPVPFSVSFTEHGTALVAEASGSLSSFNFGASAELLTMSSAVQNGQAATCWVRSTSFGVAYTTNTNSNSITSYSVSRNGNVTVLENAAADGVGAPIDFQLTPDERYLYVTASEAGGVEGYRVNRDTGALKSIGFFPGLNTFSSDGFAPQGMAVR